MPSVKFLVKKDMRPFGQKQGERINYLKSQVFSYQTLAKININKPKCLIQSPCVNRLKMGPFGDKGATPRVISLALT